MEEAAILTSLEVEVEGVITAYQEMKRRGVTNEPGNQAIVQLHISTNEMYANRAIVVYREALDAVRKLKAGLKAT